MEYLVKTSHGIFKVLQQLTYGDLIIGSILLGIFAILAFKVLYDIADREGLI